ncbi:MAG: TGS domain-containing protein [Acidobacteria bacterium]|nr:TGS domain-containing protein [Acidobacteriota bacterium]
MLKRGSTLLDVAAAVHKDVAKKFKFARLWNKASLDGQMVERSYLLEDGDLVEIHL